MITCFFHFTNEVIHLRTLINLKQPRLKILIYHNVKTDELKRLVDVRGVAVSVWNVRIGKHN